MEKTRLVSALSDINKPISCAVPGSPAGLNKHSLARNDLVTVVHLLYRTCHYSMMAGSAVMQELDLEILDVDHKAHRPANLSCHF